ncbi:hypothetical protein FACS189485_13470 [Spirochaetia bacterium]|nr:hypothetical protein FACS189485_13470 [Spirochaetia bacterium]
MKKIKLSDVIRSISAISDYHGDEYIQGVSTDTRTLKPGDLFIALKGNNYDGHDFVVLAEQKKAIAIVCSHVINTRLPTLIVKNTLKALQELALYYRSLLNIKIVAVTGSNGKTTTTNMIATVLASKYRVYATEKNYNNEIGLPKSILELDDSYDIAVLEMGMNHLGEIDILSKIAKPCLAVITMVGKAHIGLLGSQENILKAKLEVVSGLEKNGLLVLNSDDVLLRSAKTDNVKKAFVGINPDYKPELIAANIQSNKNPTIFNVVFQGVNLPCELPTIGKYNVLNSLFAIYCGTHFNIMPKDAISVLRKFTSAPMRSEISSVKGISIIKDYYNSSPDSAETALEVLSEFNNTGRKIAIFGEMFELGEYSGQEHCDLAKKCRDRKLDHVFFIGSDYISFKQGMEKNTYCFDNSDREGLKHALSEFFNNCKLTDNDTILIKGSRAMEMEEFYSFMVDLIENDGLKTPSKYQTKLLVDVSALKHNFSAIKAAVGDNIEIAPVIKANAYGLGADIIANIYSSCPFLIVGDIYEAMHIRSKLPGSNILLIYQPFPEQINFIVENNYVVSVSDLDFAIKLNKSAQEYNKRQNIHIEIDTGMGRQGILLDECGHFANEISKMENLIVDGIWTHYSCADSYTEDDLKFTESQTKKFKEGVKAIEGIIGIVKYKHACASAAIFNPNAERFNLVRPGIMLYGYYPCEELKEKILLKPALKLESVITKIKEVDTEIPISYRRTYVTKCKTRIATVPIGYQHGISRSLSNQGAFVINGQRAPVCGIICMDYTMIDITDISGPISIGDKVLIFDNVNMTIEEMAKIGKTINYEIIAKIHDNAPRIETF